MGEGNGNTREKRGRKEIVMSNLGLLRVYFKKQIQNFKAGVLRKLVLEKKVGAFRISHMEIF